MTYDKSRFISRRGLTAMLRTDKIAQAGVSLPLLAYSKISSACSIA